MKYLNKVSYERDKVGNKVLVRNWGNESFFSRRRGPIRISEIIELSFKWGEDGILE